MPYQEPPYDPFNPAYPPQDLETPPLDEVIRLAILAATMNLRVCMPCSIVKVNGNQKADVQPLLQSRNQDNTLVNLPVIHNALVSMPMGAGYSVKLPIAVGDTGFVILADRSLDNWSASSGGIVDPEDTRAHDINDAIFIPGLIPFSSQTTDSTTDLVITNGGGILKVQKAGTFILKNSSNELMDLLVQITTQVQSLSNTLSTDTVNTVFGPTKLNAFSQYQSIASTLQSLLTKLETLKGS